MEHLRGYEDKLEGIRCNRPTSVDDFVPILGKSYELPPSDIAHLIALDCDDEIKINILKTTPEVLNGVEDLATNLYRQDMYKEASIMFKEAINLGSFIGQTRNQFLRGLGSCNHAQGYYVEASYFYELALKKEPDDLILMMAQADCLCLTNNRSAAMEMAAQLLAAAHPHNDASFIARARTIITSRGRNPLLHSHLGKDR